jgi:kumamolisin
MPTQKPAKSVVLPGSHKVAPGTLQLAGSLDPNERVQITLRLRPRRSLTGLKKHLTGAAKPLTREEFENCYGARPEDIAKVEDFAHEHGLVVVEASVPRRTVVISGPLGSLTQAFKVEGLQRATHLGKEYRIRSGGIEVPAKLAPILEGVHGFDNRPQARPHFRHRPEKEAAAAEAKRELKTYTPVELGKLYNFPADADGSGQCIAIIELGGGYRSSDLQEYFEGLGLPNPKVVAISVDGGQNSPTTPDSADGEVLLDIEVAGALAPKALIAVYFAPNTDQGFLNAITSAVQDKLHKPSVISISWGSPESGWTAQSIRSYNEAFAVAGAMGVTVCAAAGDHGSSDMDPPDGKAHADYPASSPYVLGCGGTHLESSGGKITKEVVWNTRDGWAGGGGVSDLFPVPTWQKTAEVPKSANPGGKAGRGVPDVAGDADPNTGYHIRVDGQNIVSGGTSAVAPLMAALIALINQKKRKPVGYINPTLYGKGVANSGAFRDIVEGDNGAYKAGPGWDACTGLGSVDGTKLLKAL